MSSVPENNEKREIEYSVFDNPEHFEEKSEKVKKHSMRNRIIAGLLALAVIAGGTLAAVKFIPKPVEEEEKKAEIPILNLTETAESVLLKNEITTLKFLSAAGEVDGESQTVWTIEGVKSEYTQSDSIANLVKSITEMKALQKLTAEKDADYGFDESTVNAEIFTKSGSVKVTFGGMAPADIGIYCKASNDSENIYVVSVIAVTALQVVPTDFANADGYTGIELNAVNKNCFSDDGTVTDFDYIKLKSKNFSEPLEIVMQNDESLNAYFAFKVVKPMERIGNNDNSQAILNLFGKGFSAEGAYAFEPTDVVLERYNLKNPDFECTVSIAREVYTLKFGIVDETYCAFWDEKANMIEKVPIASIPFLTTSINDYYSSFLVLENLSGLKNLKIETADKSYNFDLKYTKGEETKDDVYEASFGGKPLDITSFKSYYQELIGISPIAYDTGATGETDMKITFVHSGTTNDTVLTFRKFSAQRYQVDINGLPLGLITKTTYDNFLNLTAKTAGQSAES
ncbi:MAG: DUF4340 domain-containing protein [Clostridiales bacterium]|nr:DUF4340 domain-containing protein [Candidatus Equinaster intestinalis]